MRNNVDQNLLTKVRTMAHEDMLALGYYALTDDEAAQINGCLMEMARAAQVILAVKKAARDRAIPTERVETTPVWCTDRE